MKTKEIILILLVTISINSIHCQTQNVHLPEIEQEIKFYKTYLPKRNLKKLSSQIEVLQESTIKLKNKYSDSLNLEIQKQSKILRNNAKKILKNYQINKIHFQQFEKLSPELQIEWREKVFFCLDIRLQRKIKKDYKHCFNKYQIIDGRMRSTPLTKIKSIDEFKDPRIIKFVQLDKMLMETRDSIFKSQAEDTKSLLTELTRIRAIQKDLNILNRIISFLEKHIGRGRCGNGFTREDALKEREKFEKFKLESLVLKDQIDTMLFYHAKNKEKLSKEQLENLKKVEEIYFISTYENIPSDLINLK